MYRKQKGITLIALVITIIVLLILAGVSIAMLTGENGILTQAKKAKEETEEAKNNELEILEDYENRLNEKVIQSTFIWDPDIVNFTKLDAQVEKLNLNTIYVQITSDLETSISISKLISYCQLKNIDLYLFDGGSDWYTDEEKYNVIEMIDRTSEFNKTNNNAIKGIKLDIEFHTTDFYSSLSDEEQKAEFQKFYEANKEFCEYAKEKGLKYAIDLPVWLNYLDEGILEELIKLDYDHIAYMNYDRTDDGNFENLDEEVELARKYNKKIVNIFELQDPNKHEGLPETDTYYNLGLDRCIEDMNKLLQKYNYSKLGRSYHYYEPLVELLSDETENKYDLELYPYYGEVSTEIKSAKITDENGKIYSSLSNQYKDGSQEYIITFFGLEFGKQYTLTINEGMYSYEGIIQKESDGSDIKFDSIALNQEQTFSMDIYGYDEEDNALDLNGGALVYEDQRIEGEINIDDTTGKKFLSFTGVRYGKDYTLELDDTTYEIISGGVTNFTDYTKDYLGKSVYLRKK